MNAKVCALIEEDGPRWIKEWVVHEFLSHEAQQILGIPLSSKQVPGLLIWASTKLGRYTTKSAYKMLTSKCETSTSGISDTLAQTSCWRRIWSLSVPNKIKHFLWRACRESLPTKKNLLVRNVTRDALCKWCNEEVEDSVHALWVAKYSRRSGAKKKSSKISSPCVLWNLEICGLLYQDMRVRLNEYQLAQKPPIPEFMIPGETRWYLPQSLQHKVNYDGALFKEIWQAGIGVVIKDAKGRVCGALSDRIVLPRTVEEVEAIACRTIVRFALELGLEEVVFEGDSETITTAINSNFCMFELV
nr:hypothetical protein CFP56_48039 [Quercus suber]